MVRLQVPTPADPALAEAKDEKGKGKEGQEEDSGLRPMEDDGELGREVAGRLTWETFEAGLKAWETANPPKPKPKEGPNNKAPAPTTNSSSDTGTVPS